jgi:hypothetical protein
MMQQQLQIVSGRRLLVTLPRTWLRSASGLRASMRQLRRLVLQLQMQPYLQRPKLLWLQAWQVHLLVRLWWTLLGR